MKCNEIGFGTYDCAYSIMPPYKYKSYFDNDSEEKPQYICIDKCLIHEIISLWEMGIKTTGCCCGHDKHEGYIGVKKEFIPKMKEMGYKLAFNECRPGDEDSFIPKTIMNYGEINKGFNWWDE